MTAEELLNKKVFTPYGKVDNDTVLELMIEFATYHVELATEKIKKSIESDDHFWWTEAQIDNLNLLENIK